MTWLDHLTEQVKSLSQRVRNLEQTVPRGDVLDRRIDGISRRLLTLERARNVDPVVDVDVICGEPYDGHFGRQECSLPLGHEDHSWERAAPDPVQRCKAFYIHEGDTLSCLFPDGHEGQHAARIDWTDLPDPGTTYPHLCGRLLVVLSGGVEHRCTLRADEFHETHRDEDGCSQDDRRIRR